MKTSKITAPVLVSEGQLTAQGLVQRERGTLLYREGDASGALAEWLPLAQAGHVASQYDVGLLYEGQALGAPNLDEALRWQARAGDGGHAAANCRAGMLLVRRDERSALLRLRRGAGAGEVSCMYGLATILLGKNERTSDAAEGLGWLKRAAEAGYAEAQARLGMILLKGGYGVKPDRPQARVWLSRLGDQPGFPAQMHELARMYELGVGGRRDLAKAEHYYAQAAAEGSGRSANRLGLLYRYGNGVPKDNARAAQLFQRAIELGDREAKANLADLYFVGAGVDRDRALAFSMYDQAARGGVAWASCRMAAALRFGEGVATDIGRAQALERQVKEVWPTAGCQIPLRKLLHP